MHKFEMLQTGNSFISVSYTNDRKHMVSIEQLVYFIALALLAEILGTVGGFGSSMFFVPIASYFLDFHSVLGITALFHVSSNLTKIVLFRHGYSAKLIVNMGIPAVLFVIVGSYLSKFIRTDVLEILLGSFLVAVSFILLIFKQIEVKPTVANSVVGGIFSGLIAGLLGTGGAIRGITLSAFSLSAPVFIATSAIIDLGIDSSRSIVYYLNGYITSEIIYLVPILLLVSIAGTLIGKKILTRITASQFKSIVLLLVLITGIITLAKFGLADLLSRPPQH
jgi:uncharacterized protein